MFASPSHVKSPLNIYHHKEGSGLMSNKAKRAARGSIKEPMSVPYTASSPFAVNVLASDTPRLQRQTKSGGIFSRVASVARWMLRGTPSALRYGDVLRDLPFHVNTRMVVFFSTHPSLCEDVFAARHGQCLCFTRGPWKGSKAIVVGARCGLLWVVGSNGSTTARPLVMSEADSHAWERVDDDADLVAILREGIDAARRDAGMDYDSDQRDFLQKAPDLFAEVVDDERMSDGLVTDTDVARGSLATTSRVSTEGGNKDAGRPSASWSDKGQKRVILTPQVVQSTGRLGWAGEGMVLVNGGGVESFPASLSTSVLL